MVARLSTVRKASTINMTSVELMAPARQKAGSSAYIRPPCRAICRPGEPDLSPAIAFRDFTRGPVDTQLTQVKEIQVLQSGHFRKAIISDKASSWCPTKRWPPLR